MHARNRSLSLWVTVALLSSVVMGALPGTPAGAIESVWCTEDPSPPCIESATVNGTPVTPSDSTWSPYVYPHNDGNFRYANWGVSQISTNELGAGSLDDSWILTFDVGTMIPRVAFMRGANGDTIRTDDGDGTYHVTVKGRPVIVSAGCDQSMSPTYCPETAEQEWVGYLDGQLTNYGGWDPAVQREAMYGMNFYTNIDATELPPQVAHDSETNSDYLVINLASPHFRADGATLVHGFFHMEIPNAFLRETYGVDAPATMTSSGLAPTIGSGTVTVAQSADESSMLVDAADITFSRRTLRVKRGVITPTRPTDVRATRTAAHRGRVGFDAAKARGSRITGYKARCEARRGDHVVTARADSSPVVVTDLHDGVGYDCQVRAGSRAGPGRWSEPDGMSGQP
jgi:hypothetical protein